MIERQLSSSSSKTNTVGADDLIINHQNTLVAEILWCLKVVMSHFSYRSCFDLNDLLKRMFFDSEVSAQFSLSKTKCRYMILYGIAPCCRDTLKQEINSSPFFSTSFDESMNSVLHSCQMDIGIRFLQSCQMDIGIRFLQSCQMDIGILFFKVVRWI